jgi:hypothetical protein
LIWFGEHRAVTGGLPEAQRRLKIERAMWLKTADADARPGNTAAP